VWSKRAATMRLSCRTVAGQPRVPCHVRCLSAARSPFFSNLATCSRAQRVVVSREGPVRAKAMFGGLGNFLKGDPAKKTKERMQPTVDAVNQLEPEVQGKSDEELRALTVSLKKRAQSGTPLDTLLPEAFAVRFSTCLAGTITLRTSNRRLVPLRARQMLGHRFVVLRLISWPPINYFCPPDR
jgi:hypothetical protein